MPDVTRPPRIVECRDDEIPLHMQRDLALALGTTSDLTEALNRLLEIFSHVEGLDGGGVYLVDETTGELHLAASRGLAAQFVQHCSHYSADSTHARLVMAGEPIYLPYSEIAPVDDEARQYESIRGLAIVPVRHKSRVVGTLNLASHTQYHIPARTREVIEASAAQIGVGIARLRAEQTARQEQQLIQVLLDNIPDTIYFKDCNNRYTRVNRAQARLLGLDHPNQAIGKRDADFYPPEIVAACHADERRIMETDQPIVGKVELAGRDQANLRWISTTKIPIRNAAAKIVGIAGISRDITEHIQAEKQLQFLSSITQQVKDSTIVTDTAFRITYINRAAEELFGYSCEEILGSTPNILNADPMAERIQQEIYQTVRAGKVWIGTHLNRKKDGSIFTCELKISPLTDGQGKITSYIGILRDISKRKQAEQALEESQARYQELFNSVMEGIGQVDENEVMEFCNPAYAQIFEEDSIENLLGKNLLDYLAEDQRELVLSQTALHKQNISSRYELEIITAKGNKKNILVSVSPRFDKDHRYAGGFGTVIDITERKRAEAEKAKLEVQLRHAKKMEAVGQLAGGVAHDFNNMLTTILGSTELLCSLTEQAHTLDSALKTKLLAGLELIEQAGNQAASLTGRLLDFARRPDVESGVLDLNWLLADMEMMLSHLLGEQSVLKLLPAPGLRHIQAEAGQIKQIIMNLVVNARDAMPEGGTLLIETANVILDEPYCTGHPENRPGAHVLITISDTGCGIQPDTQERIFEPFFTTKPIGKGTGLGLSTAYANIRQAGGHICFDSECGHGTTFRIYFPIVEASLDESDDSGVVTQPPGGNETVLVCEDEESVRSVACQFLKSGGYHVLTAENGEQALRTAADYDGQIHLLVTDVIMPGMNGRKLAEALSSERPETKVLYISGYTSDVVSEQDTLVWEGELLKKPFRSHDILERVREILDGS